MKQNKTNLFNGPYIQVNLGDPSPETYNIRIQLSASLSLLPYSVFRGQWCNGAAAPQKLNSAPGGE